MKYILITLLSIIAYTTSFAQGPHPDKRPSKAEHAKIEQLKRTYFSKELRLSKEDSIAFWPIYDDYSKQLKALHHSIKSKYRCKEDNTLTETEYKKLIQEIIVLEKKEVNLKAEFMLKIGETIGYEKALKLPCLEHEFRKKLLAELKTRKKY
ncbi:hypothetical protein SAMN05216474_0377 [Lishizhenia tianjinensis]|uniref:Sensor of ECF-type sigma factor n=1 Tax=Lishizhenia tianjinensis TaxID=477690 RepID=A0A1I6XR16_9FLAO|nr:hypothetical protein [Lishizhenia tianjinensis]SFT40492.1 hypothetical protein SAMN05216474_0377 [Lishizhenia tianjinensis]